jgi:hypothetical protein
MLKAELKTRMEEFEANPEAGYSWDQVKSHLGQKLADPALKQADVAQSLAGRKACDGQPDARQKAVKEAELR